MTRRKKDDRLLDFFAEIGQLKRVKRSGWWTVGITDGESVADHSFRCAVIAFCLAEKEGCDPYKAAVIGLLNDLHESRINDLHKVAHRYVNVREAEKRAHHDQVADLPQSLRAHIEQVIDELWSDKTREAIVARDADILECMLQGKEYYEQGYLQAKGFFKRSGSLLRTTTARKLARNLAAWSSSQWCEKLVLLER